MSAVCYFSYYFLHQYLNGENFIARLLEAFIPIVLGGITFLVSAKLLGVEELNKFINVVKRKTGM